MKKFLKKARWILIPAALVGIVILWVVKFEFQKPEIRPDGDSPFLGRELTFRASDRKSGLAEVRVEAVQAGRTIEVFSERFPAALPTYVKTLALRPLPAGLADGEVLLRISAKDRSWNGGNTAVVEKKMILDTRPPRMNIVGGPHYINTGGAGVVSCTVDEETPVVGSQVGERFFPGYPTGGNRFLVFFALSPDASRDVRFSGVAEDPSGNRTSIVFRPVIKTVAFKQDTLSLSDKFLGDVVSYFKNIDPGLRGTDLEAFLTVNRTQREKDYERLAILCQKTESRMLWSGAFLRLPNSKPMASFGDRRTYTYEGKVVDQQVHLGVDLASTAQCLIPAANAGRVVFAGPLGIHGLTVVLDHGLALFSMYCHLSRIDVALSQGVTRGETLGLSGSTGLAGGDHLHFAMLIHGVFVNPVEWWDAHWIRDNVERKTR
jgi:murein DD-endopeptidase MepM/ murein hydrolase activator NlpD